MDNNTSTSTYDNSDPNLPANWGQVRQAMARRSARKGGTPNAPEVDDEPSLTNPLGQLRDPSAASLSSTVGTSDASASPRVGNGQAIAGAASPQGSQQAMASNARPYVNDDPTAGGMVPVVAPGLGSTIGSAIASGVRSLVGMQQRMSDPAATQSPDTAAATPAPLARSPLTAFQPQYAPMANAPAAPGTITRDGNSFSGGNVAPAPSSPLSTMTDAQRNNAPFESQYAAMQAQGRVDQATQAMANQATLRNQNLQQNQYDARVAAQKAGRDADHANFEASITTGVGRGSARTRALLADRAAGANEAAQSRLATANTAAANGTPIDYLGELGKGQAAVSGAQAIAQNALTNPLHVQQLQQGLEAGGTQQQIAQLQFAGTQTRQSILNELAKTTDPNRHVQLTNALLAMEGKIPPPRYQVHVGALNPLTGVQPAAVLDSNMGDIRNFDLAGAGSGQAIAAPQAQGAPSTPNGQAIAAPPFQEGQTGTINGVRVKIVNGRPVRI